MPSERWEALELYVSNVVACLVDADVLAIDTLERIRDKYRRDARAAEVVRTKRVLERAVLLADVAIDAASHRLRPPNVE